MPSPPSVASQEPIKAVPVRHWGRWLAVVVLVVLAAMGLHTLFSSIPRNGQASDSRFEWSVVRQYLFDHTVLQGVVITLALTVVAMAVGVVLGIALAAMRLSESRAARWVAWGYIWFFRGTPVYVQLLFWSNVAWLYPSLGFGIPFGHQFFSIDANTLVQNTFAVAVLGLGLNEGAYMAEIVRAGILSVDHGQVEAAQSLGMRKGQVFSRIVLPQAMRVIVPPTGNETISMLKTTSLVAPAVGAIALFGWSHGDIARAVQEIYDVNYLIMPLLIVASLWYLALTSVLSIGQYFLERHYARGVAGQAPPSTGSIVQRLFSRRTPVLVMEPVVIDPGAS